MESKSSKAAMYASLMEDDSDGPGVATSFGPVSSLLHGGDAGSAPGCSRQPQQLSCVYVWSILPPPPPPIPDIPSRDKEHRP